jgi:heme oxygenase
VLKHSTQALHDELEAVPLMRCFAEGDMDRAALGHYLRLQFAIHRALEPGVAAYLPAGFVTPRKTDWLASDHQDAFGTPPADCSVPVPAVTSESTALGVAYVLEGSTLGLQMVRKRRLAGVHAEWWAASRFVRGYGDATGRHWKQLLGMLDAVPESDWPEATAAAQATFAAYLHAFTNVTGLRS